MRGERLGPYLIERELGSGGMGTVYAATVVDPGAELDVGDVLALKLVHPHLLESRGFLERFLREIEIGRTVTHPNVVSTHGGGVAGGRHYIAMEYVEGQTLRQLLEEIEVVPEQLCRHVGREICRGLTAIHGAGVIHRDLKPENVLVTPDHVVKVMDLGVARLADEVLRISQAGNFAGSIHYAAPEQLREGGRHADGRADLHALGVVLYELATGHNPFRDDDVPGILRRILNETPRRLGERHPQISAYFEEIVHTLLAKEPEGRFASASDLLGVLDDGADAPWWRERAKAIRAETDRPIRRVRVPRETAVYGRDAQIDAMRSLFEQAAAGDGAVLLVTGEAGIGKSRLIDEAVGRLHRDGTDLHFLFGAHPPAGATPTGAMVQAFREQIADGETARYLPQTPTLAEPFDAVLRGTAVPVDDDHLSPPALQSCFVQALRVLASERPTVVLVDDLHFASKEGLALFAALANAVPGHRVLLVGALRPGATDEWCVQLGGAEHVTRMDLQRLGPKDLGELLRDTFRSQQLAERLSFQIGEKSDGNPFFVFEIIRGLREGQFISRKADGTWVTTRRIDEIQIPASVLDLVNARVADLDEDQRDLLDVAACFGFEFDPGLVGDVLGLPRIPALKRFAQVERRHRLVRTAGRGMVFDHHQVQEALYGSLLPQLREEYHAAIAEALVAAHDADARAVDELPDEICVAICTHGFAGQRHARVARYLDAAIRCLERAYQNTRTMALIDQALEIPGLVSGEQRVTLLLRKAGRLDILVRREDQRAVLDEALAVAQSTGDPGHLSRVERGLGVHLWRAARYEQARDRLLRALEHAREAENLIAQAGAHGGLAVVAKAEGRMDVAREHNSEYLRLAQESGSRIGEAIATGNLGGVLLAQGDRVGARELFERYRNLSREIGNRQGEVIAIGNIGNLLAEEGRLDEALERHERYLELAREIGHRNGEAVAMGNLGNVFHAQGRLEAAREHHARCVDLARESANRSREATALHNLARALAAAGDSQTALDTHADALEIARDIGSRDREARNLLAMGVLRDAMGQEGAVDDLVAARRLADEIDQPRTAVVARCHLACLGAGVADDASAKFEREAERLDAEAHREARLLLYRATGDTIHLDEAMRSLDRAIGLASQNVRRTMVENLPVNREITALRSGD